MTNHTETVKSLYAAFGRGDIAFILGNLAADVIWGLEGTAEIPYAGIYRGPEQVKYFFDALGRTSKDTMLDMTVSVSEGNKVAMFGRYAATINGKRVNSNVAHLFVFNVDGKLAEFHDFFNTAAVAFAYR